ncbi:MAG: MerR family transcriptional regulator [Alphaproteobacteria bacterium]|nr:MAG: MerR family transcriptional regulator [Alphaproteobacteria bacterium]
MAASRASASASGRRTTRKAHDGADKSPAAYRTIGEVAEIVGVPQHVLRFWETRFAQLRPLKRSGNRRYYRPEDVALLQAIRILLHEQGLTIRGVQKRLKEEGRHRLVAAVLGRAGTGAEARDDGGIGQAGSCQAALSDAGSANPKMDAADGAEAADAGSARDVPSSGVSGDTAHAGLSLADVAALHARLRRIRALLDLPAEKAESRDGEQA